MRTGHSLSSIIDSRIASLMEWAIVWFHPGKPIAGREAFQLRFMIGACTLGVLVGVASCVADILEGAQVEAIIVACFAVVMAGHPLALRLGAPMERLFWTVMATLWVFLILHSLTTVSFEPTRPFWLVLLPLVAWAWSAPMAEDVAVPEGMRFTEKGLLFALTAAGVILAARQLGLTFGQANVTTDAAYIVDVALFLATVFGLVQIYDVSAREAATELLRMRSLLHVCAWCKKIQDDDEWITLEDFAERRTGSELTHGICPSCGHNHFPGVF
jgi:uncharacterized membrane protein